MRLMFRDDDPDRDWSTTVPGGDAGVMHTLAAMREFVADSIGDPRIQTLAAALASRSDLERHDRIGQLNAVYDWLRHRTRFKADPVGTEHLRHPIRTLGEIVQNGSTACDCDDVAMLGAALVAQLGFRPVFIVAARDASTPFEHVFYGARVGGVVMPFDPQEGVPPGEWPKTMKRIHVEPAIPS